MYYKNYSSQHSHKDIRIIKILRIFSGGINDREFLLK